MKKIALLGMVLIPLAIAGCSDADSGSSNDDDDGSNGLDLDAKLYNLVSDSPALEWHSTSSSSTVLITVRDGKCGVITSQYTGARTGNAEAGYSNTLECNQGSACEYGQTWSIECVSATSAEELICGSIVFRVMSMDECPD